MHHYLLYTKHTTAHFTPLLTLHHTPLPALHHIPLPILHHMHIHHYLLYTTNTTTCSTPLPIHTTHTTTHFISHAICFTPNTHTTTCFTQVPILHHTHHYPLYITQYYLVYITVHTPLPALHYTHCNLFFIMLYLFYARHQYLLYTTCTHAHTHKPQFLHCVLWAHISCKGFTNTLVHYKDMCTRTNACTQTHTCVHTPNY